LKILDRSSMSSIAWSSGLSISANSSSSEIEVPLFASKDLLLGLNHLGQIPHHCGKGSVVEYLQQVPSWKRSGTPLDNAP
jgi:hypothetical protein